MINTEFYSLGEDFSCGSFGALIGVIKSAEVYLHRLDRTYSLKREPSASLSVYFLIDGDCTYNGNRILEFTTFIPSVKESVLISSDKASSLLEIKIELSKSELDKVNKKLPIIIPYEKARAYKEDCKSEKTTSRMILEDGIIPRFAMGSVETTGPDVVSEHKHATVDQFFFSLPKTKSFLTVSGEKLFFPEKTAMHIPLGSYHGVLVMDGEKMHYLWCDFYLNEESSEYIKSAHKFI